MVFLSMMSTGEGWKRIYARLHCVAAAVHAGRQLPDDRLWQPAVGLCAVHRLECHIDVHLPQHVHRTVVENFSYIFDLGSKAILTPSDIRHFKSSWAASIVNARATSRRIRSCLSSRRSKVLSR